MIKKIIISLVLIISGFIVFVPTIGYSAEISQSVLQIIWVLTFLGFFVLAIIFNKKEILNKYWKLPLLFSFASLSIFISWLFANIPKQIFGYSLKTPFGVALAKLFGVLLIIIPLLFFIKYSKIKFKDIFLQKGKFKLSIIIGIILFLLMYSIAYLHAKDGKYLTFLLESTPWLLVFCLSNAFMEELLFRGIFLKEFEKFIGRKSANFITAIIFTAAHMNVSYVPDLTVFLIVLFILALSWGVLMQKTESLIASTLFHAGADTIIFAGIVANLGGNV